MQVIYAVMQEAICGEKIKLELDTQYKDCKRADVSPVWGGVGGQTGNTGTFPNIDSLKQQQY